MEGAGKGLEASHPVGRPVSTGESDQAAISSDGVAPNSLLRLFVCVLVAVN